jgi:hypothetical protein
MDESDVGRLGRGRQESEKKRREGERKERREEMKVGSSSSKISWIVTAGVESSLANMN